MYVMWNGSAFAQCKVISRHLYGNEENTKIWDRRGKFLAEGCNSDVRNRKQECQSLNRTVQLNVCKMSTVCRLTGWKLRKSENRVTRRIFMARAGAGGVECKRISKFIHLPKYKIITMKWTGHVALLGEIRNTCKIFWREPEACVTFGRNGVLNFKTLSRILYS